MNKQHINPVSKALRPTLLAGAIGVALAANSAQALDFSGRDFELSIDTNVSYALGVRVEDRQDNMVGKAAFNPAVSALPIEQQIMAPGRFSNNSDDGNLNFDSGEVIFNQARITSELSFSYKNYGAFVRGNFFHDFKLNNKDALSEDARDIVGQRARLLDAYVYADVDLDGHLFSTRLGRQVVSWGESTFIPGGLSVLNPVDVTALRTAGAELRDAFIPLAMSWSSLEITSNFSVEGLLFFEWDRVEPEAAGSFFSTNDFAVDGGRYAMLGFGLLPDDPLSAPGCGVDPIPITCFPAGALPRANDVRPEDTGSFPDLTGEFGLAARYFAPWLNDTEFGLFYLHYHSRLPLISGTSVTSTNVSSGRFNIVYPEDIDVIAGSFNTTIFESKWAWQGEVSYSPNLPLQLDDVEVLFAGLSPLNAVIPEPVLRFKSQLGDFPPGTDIRGFMRRDVSRAQMTFTRLTGPIAWLGANDVALVGEVGAMHVWDLPEESELRFNGPGTDTGGGPGNQLNGGDLRNPVTTTDGFATDFSWGYRLVIAPTYNSFLGTAWNLTPRIAFNHDVTGVSPGPGGNFVEDRKSLTLGARFSLLNRWRVDLGYTSFFGGGNKNLLNDRDFVSAAISYSF
ncbi:MAG: DUF1302 domain-containing protein [Wenzhouxiangellaceae bacterium]|nr:DUF1302 domain-containing protein [Wenzhouxiangellaceae bacterium]